MQSKTRWLNLLSSPMRRTRIVWRLAFMYVIVCLLPVVCISAVYQANYLRDVRTKLGVDSLKILTMMDQRQTDLLQNMENIAGNLSVSQPVQRLLSEPNLSDYEKHTLVRELSQLVVEKTVISRLIKNVIVVNTENQIAFSMGYEVLNQAKLQELYLMAQETLPLEFITGMTNPQTGQADILLVRIIKSSESAGQHLGYLYLTMSEEDFAQETYRDIYAPEQGQILLLGDDGTIISGESEGLIPGTKLEDPALLQQIEEQYPQQNPHFSISLGGVGYWVSFLYNSKTQWYAVSMIQDSYLTAETRNLSRTIMLLAGGSIVLGLLSMILIAASIVRPVERLVRYCQSIHTAGPPQEIHDTGKDELGYLTNTVSQMVLKLDAQSEKEKQDSLERKNLEIQMLQAQINPHFLFNTLNSIKMIALMSRVPVVADGLSALANILRSSIINRNEMVTMAEEFRNIEDYAFIQQLRYAQQFRLSLTLPEDCSQQLIPKFLLQPIVENAIIHGVEHVSHCVTIRVEAALDEHGVTVLVADDGAGFDMEAQKSKSSGAGRMSGIGMGNVEQRLRLVFGAEAQMVVVSAPEQGTTVTLTLPARRPEDV